MRALLPMIAASLLVHVACADDGVPSYVPAQVVEQSSPATPDVSDDEPQVSQAADEAELEPSEAEQDAAAEESAADTEPERDRPVIFRLTEHLDVYQWPGEGWRPFVRHRPNTLLLADGRTALQNGDLWLRLNLNGNVEGWVRQHDTPLTDAEARSLAWVSVGELPTAEIDGPDGEIIQVTLMGQTADGQQLLIRLPGTDQALRVDRAHIEFDREWSWLPIYEGPAFGEWRPPRLTPRVVVKPKHGTAALHLQPGGEPSGLRIFHYEQSWSDVAKREYPVLGRSLDGQWIAVRLDDFEPAVVWVELEQVELSVEPDALPYFLSGETEVVQIGEDGRIVGAVERTHKLYHWQWRDDGAIVGSASGLWRWYPERDDEAVQVAPPQWVVFSPDGRYAASGTRPNYETGDLTRDITITPIDGGEPVTFVDAGAAYFTHHESDPTLHWSRDSRYLVSTFTALEEGGWSGFYVLGVDGSRVEFSTEQHGSFSLWLPDGTLLTSDQDAMRVFSQDGSLLRELPTVGWSYPLGATMKSLVRGGDVHPSQVLNLLTGQLLSMPAPLDVGQWAAMDPLARRGLRYGERVLFLRPSDDAVSVAMYDAVSHSAVELPDLVVQLERPQSFYPSALWAANGERAAVILEREHGFIIDLASGSVRAIPFAEHLLPYEWGSLIAWSPDGRWLLTRSLRASDNVGDDGVAAFPARLYYARAPVPYIMEYHLIDAESGLVAQRFRANPQTCWSGDHTAAFSPDGRWLAFSGRDTDCT